MKHKHRDSRLEIHWTQATRGNGAPGALVTSVDDSATPWGPQAKKQWAPVCKKHWHNLSSFPPSPSHSPSLYLSCSFVLPLSLTGREQGMLIKDCENQEEKGRAHRDTERKITSKEWCVSLRVDNKVEVVRWDLWQNTVIRKWTNKKTQMKNYSTRTTDVYRFGVDGWGFPGEFAVKLHHTRTMKRVYKFQAWAILSLPSKHQLVPQMQRAQVFSL